MHTYALGMDGLLTEGQHAVKSPHLSARQVSGRIAELPERRPSPPPPMRSLVFAQCPGRVFQDPKALEKSASRHWEHA